MKRILLLADINSSHTQKWVVALSAKGLNIAVFSLRKSNSSWYSELPNFELYDDHTIQSGTFNQKTFKKIYYLKVLPSLKKVIELFNPDILHAHYASSYGLIGALCKFHPFIISLWGSDVFDFPKRGFINKIILKFNLSKADLILSTSKVMKSVAELYTNKKIIITPFGVDTTKFKLFEPNKATDEIVIGTIKGMEDTYGISYLIEAFKIVSDKYPHLNLRLLLVGDGTKTREYKKLAIDLNIISGVKFTGSIPYSRIVEYHNMIDVFVAVSLQESFGVAVLEASACEKPVVVSNVGGLPEVVMDGVTGFIVPSKNTAATANAIEKLVLDKNLRTSFGKAGRKFVIENYSWTESINQMINIYNSITVADYFPE